MAEELNLGLARTNPDSDRVEDLNQRPPDFKSNALNHLATPPPFNLINFCIVVYITLPEFVDM